MRCLVLAGTFLALCAPTTAVAQSGEATSYKVFTDYVKDGQVDPCKFTTAQLETALDAITPDIRQYASDYPKAIKDAISARARGACDKSSGGGAASTPTPVPTAAASVSPGVGGASADGLGGAAAGSAAGEPPGPPAAGASGAQPSGVSGSELGRAAAASPDNDAPAPLIGLGILAALLLLTAALLVVMKRLGTGEGRLAGPYHSMREAQWRAGGVWDDFRDWLSTGR